VLYLADVPGFMIGSEVERGGIVCQGAEMVSAVASATGPELSVVGGVLRRGPQGMGRRMVCHGQGRSRAGVARMRGLYCLILVELDVLDNRLLDAQQGAP